MLYGKICIKTAVILLLLSFSVSFAQPLDSNTMQQMQDYLKTSQNQLTANSKQANPRSGSENDDVASGNLAGTDKKGSTGKMNLSDYETIINAGITEEGFESVRQYGYEVFNSLSSNLLQNFQSSVQNSPVDPNYVIGPGDSFNITMWGVSEGVFKVTVNQNGEIALPKIGMVGVAGISYSQLKPFIEGQLSKYYQGINVAITFDTIKSIHIYVVGEVKMPGNYNLTSLSTAYNALFYAGGPTKQGSLRNIKILRKGRTVATLDLYKFLMKGDNSQDIMLQSGDTVYVPLIGDLVTIVGNVNRPAIYEVKGKADLANVLSLAGGVNPSSYLNRIQIERTVAHERKIVMDKNLTLSEDKSNYGVPIQNMDIIKIFPIYSKINNWVILKGAIKHPGTYEYKSGMRLLDVLKKDSFIPSVGLPHIEISRIQQDLQKMEIYPVDYDKLFGPQDDTANIYLKPGDEIFVSSSVVLMEQISIRGEVRRPGDYTILKGEKISSIIARAGGYTDSAYLFGAMLTRKSVKDAQAANYSKFISNLELDLLRRERELISSLLSKEDMAMKQVTYERTKQILDFLKSASLSGRVIIRLDSIDKLKAGGNDIELEDGDVLFIPKMPKSVVVLGEVYNPSAVAYMRNLKIKDCLNRVGGATNNADSSGMYIVRSDGSVVSSKQGVNIADLTAYPGDTVLVPEKLDTSTAWSRIAEFTKWLFEASMAFFVLIKVIQ